MGKVTETVEPAADLFNKEQGETKVRNPARIPHMLNLMLACWAQEDMTDMRMGQLLTNAARMGGWPNDDIWSCEDEIFARGFLRMLKGDMEAGS